MRTISRISSSASDQEAQKWEKRPRDRATLAASRGTLRRRGNTGEDNHDAITRGKHMTEEKKPEPTYWDDYEPTFPPKSAIEVDRRRVSRSEMADRVSKIAGVKITENNLRYWEDRRWVPLPRREGSPSRALYP